MPRQRLTLHAGDLAKGTRITHPSEPTVVFTLSAPMKRNVNKNVVDHCRILKPDGSLVSEGWFNRTNLKEMGYKLAPVAIKAKA